MPGRPPGSTQAHEDRGGEGLQSQSLVLPGSHSALWWGGQKCCLSSNYNENFLILPVADKYLQFRVDLDHFLSLCIPWEKNTTKRKQLNNRGISEFPRIFCSFLCAWEEITCAQEPAWSRESWSSCRSSPERNWVLKDSVRYQPTCSSRLQYSWLPEIDTRDPLKQFPVLKLTGLVSSPPILGSLPEAGGAHRYFLCPQCSVTCGKGYRQRLVSCSEIYTGKDHYEYGYQNTVNCPGTQPPHIQPCYLRECPILASWRVGNWGSVSLANFFFSQKGWKNLGFF